MLTKGRLQVYENYLLLAIDYQIYYNLRDIYIQACVIDLVKLNTAELRYFSTDEF